MVKATIIEHLVLIKENVENIDHVDVALQPWQVFRACLWTRKHCQLCSKSKLFSGETIWVLPRRRDRAHSTNCISLPKEKRWQKGVKEPDLVLFLRSRGKREEARVLRWVLSDLFSQPITQD